MVLNQGWFCSPGDNRQCLESFLVVISWVGGGGGATGVPGAEARGSAEHRGDTARPSHQESSGLKCQGRECCSSWCEGYFQFGSFLRFCLPGAVLVVPGAHCPFQLCGSTGSLGGVGSGGGGGVVGRHPGVAARAGAGVTAAGNEGWEERGSQATSDTP